MSDDRPAAVARKLPGKPRPRKDVIAELEAYDAKVRERHLANNDMDALRLYNFFHSPQPKRITQWRLQLDCGHIVEDYTYGDRLPTEGQWDEPFHRGKLPLGQYWHWHEGDDRPTVEQKVVSWDERVREVPPDPIEPPEHWRDHPEVWAKIRSDLPRAYWKVTLSCGHRSTMLIAVEWSPEDGHSYPEVSAEQVAAAHARLDESQEAGLRDEGIEHGKRWWSEGCPTPDTHTSCNVCPNVRWIVAYQSHGTLVQDRPAKPKKPSRQSVQRKLADAKREAKRLEDQLAAMGDDDD
jgi:hypothetical protein